MAFVSTVEIRNHVLGDLLLISGTFTNGAGDAGGSISLADKVSTIIACGANAGSGTAGTGAGVDGVYALINTTGPAVVVQNVNGQDGTWWALGRR
tara:strand:- start:903 stop:1187 length:285 start_codon:yes stop_codon:yes gene_type:complete